MRFARPTSALDRLADALRRAEASWQSAEVLDWDQLTQSDREEWRNLARLAALEVVAELSAA
jgi:hypothetical protein